VHEGHVVPLNGPLLAGCCPAAPSFVRFVFSPLSGISLPLPWLHFSSCFSPFLFPVNRGGGGVPNDVLTFNPL